MIKVFNETLNTYRLTKTLKALSADIAPSVVELLDHDAIFVKSRDAAWDAPLIKREDEEYYRMIRVGGIDVTVEASTVNLTRGPKISFGVRTDKEGNIDLGKLAEKFAARWDEIQDLISLHDNNMKERRRRQEKRRSNAEVVDKLVEEGLLKNIREVTERSDGFEASIILMDEEELRAYLKFKNELLTSIEVK